MLHTRFNLTLLVTEVSGTPPGWVLAALAGDGQVILDADPAELRERLDPRPVDAAAASIGARGIEQLLDEIDPRFHGHHEPLLEHAREPQVRVAVGARDVAALGRAHEPAD